MSKLEKLSNSKLNCLKSCLKKFHLKYNMKLERDRDSAPLRIGTAVHLGIETWQANRQVNEEESRLMAIDAATHDYAGHSELDVECETVKALLWGYFWHYENDDIETISVEKEFELPLINPETGAASKTFRLAGKIDAICKRGDQVLIRETKTTGESIGEGTPYWLRLRFDPQISTYILASQEIGYDIWDCLYDVIRKPSIKPKQVYQLDEEGLKIVLTENGDRALNKDGTPKQTGGKGYTVLQREETPEEYGKRLLEDISKRPEFYYQRRIIPRLEGDIEEFRLELWQIAKQLMDCRRHDRWFRTVSRNSCDICEFKDLCLTGEQVDINNPPNGFTVREVENPELEGVQV